MQLTYIFWEKFQGLSPKPVQMKQWLKKLTCGPQKLHQVQDLNHQLDRIYRTIAWNNKLMWRIVASSKADIFDWQHNRELGHIFWISQPKPMPKYCVQRFSYGLKCISNCSSSRNNCLKRKLLIFNILPSSLL